MPTGCQVLKSQLVRPNGAEIGIIMIYAKLNETVERCKKAAFAAFTLADIINASESGGIGPARKLLGGTFTKKGDEISVKLNYTYPETCGLSDRVYHIKDAGKTFTDIYTFKNGKASLNGGKLFEEPWLSQTKMMQENFFSEFSDIICA